MPGVSGEHLQAASSESEHQRKHGAKTYGRDRTTALRNGLQRGGNELFGLPGGPAESATGFLKAVVGNYAAGGRSLKDHVGMSSTIVNCFVELWALPGHVRERTRRRHLANMYEFGP